MNFRENFALWFTCHIAPDTCELFYCLVEDPWLISFVHSCCRTLLVNPVDFQNHFLLIFLTIKVSFFFIFQSALIWFVDFRSSRFCFDEFCAENVLALICFVGNFFRFLYIEIKISKHTNVSRMKKKIFFLRKRKTACNVSSRKAHRCVRVFTRQRFTWNCLSNKNRKTSPHDSDRRTSQMNIKKATTKTRCERIPQRAHTHGMMLPKRQHRAAQE